MTDQTPPAEPTTAMPRWVKVGIIIAAVAILALIALAVLGDGDAHGPGRH
jgi:hypothetical protein